MAPLTLVGKKALDEELDNLIRNEREKIKKAIAEARANGDLSENADYQFAKEKQSHIEGRILVIQGTLAAASIVDVAKIKSDRIAFGATVKMQNMETEQAFTYQIVGEDEADLKKGKISYSGPLGKALIGKKAGDTAIVKAPKGDIEYEIESFEYI